MFSTWFFNGCIQGAIICFFSFSILEQNFINEEGRTLNFWGAGAMIFGLVVVVCNLKVFLHSYDYSVGSLFFILGMMIMYLITLAVINSMSSSYLHLMLARIMDSIVFHLGNILVFVFLGMIDYAAELYLRWKTKGERRDELIQKK